MNLDKLNTEMNLRAESLKEELGDVIIPTVEIEKEDDDGFYLLLKVDDLSARVYVHRSDVEEDPDFYNEISMVFVYDTNLALQKRDEE